MRRHWPSAVALLVAACGGSNSDSITYDARATVDARSVDAGGATSDARPVDAGAAVDARIVDAPTGTPAFDAPTGTPAFDAPTGTPAFDAPITTPDAPIVVVYDAPTAPPPPDAAPDAPPPVVVTAVRVDTLQLLDPHPVGSDCSDGFLTGILNNLLQSNLDSFALNVVLLLEPLDAGDGVTKPAELVLADCTATGCTADGSSTRFASNVTSHTSAECLAALAGTLTSGDAYPGSTVPAVTPDGGACFVSDEEDISFTFSGITISLEAARVAARFDLSGADVLLDGGLLRGFISEDEAEAIEVPIFGNLASLLWGGQGNGCDPDGGPANGDKDVGPDGVTLGWYFYLAFTAEEVPYDETP